MMMANAAKKTVPSDGHLGKMDIQALEERLREDEVGTVVPMIATHRRLRSIRTGLGSPIDGEIEGMDRSV